MTYDYRAIILTDMNRSDRNLAAEIAQDEARRARMAAKAPMATSALELVQAALYEPQAGTVAAAIPTLEALVILLGGARDKGSEISYEDAVDVYMFVQVATAAVPAPEPPTPALCVRWGTGADQCVRPYEHLGWCLPRAEMEANIATPRPVPAEPAPVLPANVQRIFDRIARSH